MVEFQKKKKKVGIGKKKKIGDKPRVVDGWTLVAKQMLKTVTLESLNHYIISSRKCRNVSMFLSCPSYIYESGGRFINKIIMVFKFDVQQTNQTTRETHLVEFINNSKIRFKRCSTKYNSFLSCIKKKKLTTAVMIPHIPYSVFRSWFPAAHWANTIGYSTDS